MNLQKRVEELEQRTFNAFDFPKCIFIVPMTVDDDGGRDVHAYTAGDRSWSRREGEGPEQFKERVAAEVANKRRESLLRGRCVRFGLRITTTFALQNSEIKIALTMWLRCFAHGYVLAKS